MAETEIQLEDLLESYPSITTPQFQTIISAKEEFASLASTSTERLTTARGSLFKHQKLLQRYLRVYDDMLIIDETGTGKTCTVFALTELVYDQVLKFRLNPETADEKLAHFKRVIVLVKGPTQKNEVRNQLVCKCTTGRYDIQLSKEALASKKGRKEASRKSQVTKEIKKWYTITTYKSFTNKLKKDYIDAGKLKELQEDFSDTIFWIDEGHNILIEDFDQAQQKSRKKEKEVTYEILWTLFHTVLRSKRIITTATPMLNNTDDLRSILNLILPEDKVLPLNFNPFEMTKMDKLVFFPDLTEEEIAKMTSAQLAPYFRGQIPQDLDFNLVTLEQIEPYLRGRISYVRALNTGAVPEYMTNPDYVQSNLNDDSDQYEYGGEIYEMQMEVFKTTMSELQSEAYLRSGSNAGKSDEIYTAARQASIFVFPDGHWGSGRTEEEKQAIKETRRQKNATRRALEAGLGETLPELTHENKEFSQEVDDEEILEDDELPETEQFEKRGFYRYVNVKGDSYSLTSEFVPWLGPPNEINTETLEEKLYNISLLSCKYEAICRTILTTEGNAFVYSEYVLGSGAIVFALCLEALGFERFNESTSIFESSSEVDTNSICTTGQDISLRRVKSSIKPRTTLVEDPERPGHYKRVQNGPLRYALLTRNTSDAKFQSMMEAMNSYENRHGDYINVLIVSRVGRDGINVNNVTNGHLIGAEWNPAAMLQALSRFLRATSHEDLLKEVKDHLLAEDKDPELARIPVQVYRHAAVPQTTEPDTRVIDLYMYHIAEGKDRQIRKIMRMLKQCAIGAQINYLRNVRPDVDVDGSVTCDYDICEYRPVDPIPDAKERDYSTYDVLYAGEVIEEAINSIITVFRQRNALSLEQMVVATEKVLDLEKEDRERRARKDPREGNRFLPSTYRTKYIIMALEVLIRTKRPVLDRFGYTSYIREDYGMFYLDHNYPTGEASYPMAIYSEGIIAVQRTDLAEIMRKLETSDIIELSQELKHLDARSEEFLGFVDEQTLEGKVFLIERALQRKVEGTETDQDKVIIEHFSSYIFQVHDPETELEKAYALRSELRSRRGRRPNPETKKRTKRVKNKDVNFVLDTATEEVYLHMFYVHLSDYTRYRTTARFNKAEGLLRILKPSELANGQGWRDVNDFEYSTYNTLLQIKIKEREKTFEKMGIYGRILDDKFMVINKTLEDEKAKNDGRRIRRGRICESLTPKDLTDLLWQIGGEDPYEDSGPVDETLRPELVKFLNKKKLGSRFSNFRDWDLRRLIFYYKWYSYSVPDRTKGKKGAREALMCQKIMERMKATGRFAQ